MSITGIALVLFLLFHAAMNVTAVFSAEEDEVCDMESVPSANTGDDAGSYLI